MLKIVSIIFFMALFLGGAANHMKEAPLPELPCFANLCKLSKAELYPFLDEFYNSSPSFQKYWDKSLTVERAGAQTQWNNIAANSALLVQSYLSFINRDRVWFDERCPGFPEKTYEAIVRAAAAIDSHPKLRKIFFLMLYARDFGWADTGQGQFHQTTGQPIIRKILEELKYDQPTINICVEWQGNHSMPAEMFLGEPSLRTVKELLDKWDQEDRCYYSMLAMLSVLELNCLTKDRSAVYGDNTSMLMMIADRELHFRLYERLVEERILHLASSKMRLSTTPEAEQQAIREKTAERAAIIQEWLSRCDAQDQQKISRFLTEVDLHYVAATFPQISPQAIARFIKISSDACFGKTQHTHVINMRQDAAGAALLDQALVSEKADQEVAEKLLSVNPESCWLVWTPI